MYTEPRMDTDATIAQRYRVVMERIAAAAKRSGRRAEDILLIAVSKYADMDQVRELISLGHRDFGESRAQQLSQRAAMTEELLQRHQSLPGTSAAHLAEIKLQRVDQGPLRFEGPPSGVRWHMIGHLQRNKAKKVVGVARLIHSIDSLRLVEEVQHIAFKRDEQIDVLVQVNCSGERSKFGCPVPAAAHLCEQIDTMVHLRVRGIMTMAPYTEDPELSRPVFERCQEIFDDAQRRGVGGAHFNILSMGMTTDFEPAIECGANVVRIGTALFGEHPTPAGEHDQDDEEG